MAHPKSREAIKEFVEVLKLLGLRAQAEPKFRCPELYNFLVDIHSTKKAELSKWMADQIWYADTWNAELGKSALTPIVAHKAETGNWLVSMRVSDFVKLVKEGK